MIDNTLTEEQREQKDIMIDILRYINKYDSKITILKGGTSLMIGYNLDRFSEDIDLDSTNKEIGIIIFNYAKDRNYNVTIKKDTNTVKRYMMEYATGKKIKIEISYRNKILDKKDFNIINDIKIYTIERIFGMKLNAYTNRDKIRDLYDIVFISKNYWDCLSDFAKGMLKDSLGFKGLEQFDYLMMYQEDELINKDKLSNDFLELFDKLGLLTKPTEEDENDFCM